MLIFKHLVFVVNCIYDKYL